MKKAIFASILTYLIFFWQLFIPNYSFWNSDAQYQYIPSRYYLYEKIIEDKSFPFWTERMFLGFPIYADFENAYLNPINILSIIFFGPLLSYKILHFISYLVGSICLYWWMRKKEFGLLSFIVANLIYFFNSFMINHQIHFNVVAGLYLFPAIIYLIDEIIEKFETKKIILFSFVVSYIALWGHAQTTFLVCLGGLIYFIYFAYKRLSIRKSLYFSALILLLVLIQILPQYIPSFNLYQTSLRESNIDYTQGSLIPRIASIIFVPYLFGKAERYIAPLLIYSDYSYTETYIYLGLSSFVLGLLGIIVSKKNRLFFALYTYIIFFIFISFNAHNPLLNENTPIINLFRYWQRSMILFSFSFAILAATFIEKFKYFIFDRKNFLFSSLLIIIPILYVYLISYLPTEFYANFKYEGLNILKVTTSIKNLIKINDFEILVLIIILISVTVFTMFIVNKIIKNKLVDFILVIFLVCIVLSDLYYFNQDILQQRINNISKFIIPKTSQNYDNTRVLARYLNLEGMENIYPKNWSPFGYSQLKEDEYVKVFYDSGLGKLKRSDSEFPKDDLKKISDIGIKFVLEKESEVIVSNKKIEIIKEDIDGEYLKKNEGNIEMVLNSDKDQKVTLLLKYNKNWKIMLNNNEIDYTKENIFMGINILKGENKISIKYIPYDFYLGIVISIILSIPTYLLIKFQKKIIHE